MVMLADLLTTEAPSAQGQDRSQRLYPALQRPPGDPELISEAPICCDLSSY